MFEGQKGKKWKGGSCRKLEKKSHKYSQNSSVSSDDGKGDHLKMKHAQVGESEQVEVPSSGKKKPQENVPVMMDEKSESHSSHRIEPLVGCQESGELATGLGAACRNFGQEESKRGKALFSRYGRRYSPKLYEHHSSQMEVKNNDGLEFEGSLHSYSLAKHEIIHTREKGYKYADCGKRFCQSSDLLRHEVLHTGTKPPTHVLSVEKGFLRDQLC